MSVRALARTQTHTHKRWTGRRSYKVKVHHVTLICLGQTGRGRAGEASPHHQKNKIKHSIQTAKCKKNKLLKFFVYKKTTNRKSQETMQEVGWQTLKISIATGRIIMIIIIIKMCTSTAVQVEET